MYGFCVDYPKVQLLFIGYYFEQDVWAFLKSKHPDWTQADIVVSKISQQVVYRDIDDSNL